MRDVEVRKGGLIAGYMDVWMARSVDREKEKKNQTKREREREISHISSKLKTPPSTPSFPSSSAD